ncbi:YaiI/YqxD family protein [Candidatus Puniceispirillum sp.]|nr:YaiI/YqxD family protein [Candidatus Puniceispirillum sp.]
MIKSTIYIDADACPVKAEAEQIATRHQLRLVIVSNGGIRPSTNPLVQLVIVAEGPDVADQYIAGHSEIGDIVVTGDIPLAAKVLANDVVAIRHNGDVFTKDNIGGQLATRDLMTDIRAADPFLVQSSRKGGNAAFTDKDRSRFRNALEAEIQKIQKRS